MHHFERNSSSSMYHHHHHHQQQQETTGHYLLHPTHTNNHLDSDDRDCLRIDVFDYFNAPPGGFTQCSNQRKQEQHTTNRSSSDQPSIDSTLDSEISNCLLFSDTSLNYFIQRSSSLVHGSSVDTELLRAIALALYRYKIITLEILLWTTFLKSGTGCLHDECRGPRLWPKLFQTKIQSYKCNQQENETIDEVYERIVEDHLRKLKQKQEYVEEELIDKIFRIDNYHNTIGPLLQEFLQNQLHVLQKKYESTIAMIRYDYEEQRLLHEIRKQNSGDHEVSHLYLT